MQTSTKLLRIVILAFATLTISLNGYANTNTESLHPGVTTAELNHKVPIHWVSVAQIQKSLEGQPPMAVAFDVDDTVLLSSGVFYHGKQLFSPGSSAYLYNQKFWDAVAHEGWDKFSIPKKSAQALIDMHLARGDSIYFITARTNASDGKEALTGILQQDFNIPKDKMHKVIYTKTVEAKVAAMHKDKIKIYYGDSDGDMTTAKEAGAQGIRILRATNSTNNPHPKNGNMGEWVVINSDH